MESSSSHHLSFAEESRAAPVTPAMHRGWAPKTEKTKAAMKDDSKTPATPYSLVVSIKSRGKAMSGRTLGNISCGSGWGLGGISPGVVVLQVHGVNRERGNK